MKKSYIRKSYKRFVAVYTLGLQIKLEQEVSSITTDSRKAEPGTLFVPIVGERVDAHKFIPQVMEAGALCHLIRKSAGKCAIFLTSK